MTDGFVIFEMRYPLYQTNILAATFTKYTQRCKRGDVEQQVLQGTAFV